MTTAVPAGAAQVAEAAAAAPIDHEKAAPASAVRGGARATSTSEILRVALIGLAIFALALAPRMMHRDLFPTSDEDAWMRRAGGFTFGLVNGQLGRTYQNGHPGVTTMWIATLAQGPEGALRFADRVHGRRYVAQVPGYLEGLAQARIGFAVLGALGAAICAFLLWRLFGPAVGLLSGAMLALEPFLVANAQLVHVDGPLATFTAVAALAAVVRWRAGGGRGYLVLCGVATGLALLSKTPAVFLLAFVPLAALAGWAGRAARQFGAAPQPGSGGWGAARAALDLTLWLGLALVTFVALWPALWVLGPADVLGRMVEFTRQTGAEPDEVGSFFFGQVGGDPGPLYYPVATLFRLSPLATVGLAALLLAIARLDRAARLRVGWLVAFALGFGLMMTLGSKKFDRYLLPIYPILLGLAAVGLVAAWGRLAGRFSSPRTLAHDGAASASSAPAPHSRGAAAHRGIGGRPVAPAAVTLVAAAAAAWPVMSTAPYPLSYYNPLLGGGAAAQRTVMVGNGEGLDQAAEWLRAQPGIEELQIRSHSWDILAALGQFDGDALRDGIPGDADYIVTYGRRIQMRRWGPSLDRYLRANPPVHVVRINGIEYVHIHPGPTRGVRP